jgi:hypothetical protein
VIRKTLITASLVTLASAGIVAAQRTLGGSANSNIPPVTSPTPLPSGGGVYVDPRISGPRNRNFGRGSGRLQSARPGEPTDLSDRHGIIEWPIDSNFKKDLFTFARLEYHSYRWTDSWLTDFPDSDLDFSFRLQQLTSMKVNPVPVRVKITDKELFDYPFLYMLEVATLTFYEDEIEPLHRYLTNGGFLMIDDFWGDQGWESFKMEMKRILPDVEPTELDLSHPIFHCVFDLKEKPQVPGITHTSKESGITTETTDGDGLPHYWAWLDKKGRMMALACHNTDLGDGWEREGEDPWYFQEFSVKKSYPMGVNIVFYAMTH